MDPTCCHGNRYDVASALKVLPNNRVAKIFIVCLHYEISFFGIFHRFTNTIATKSFFEPPYHVSQFSANAKTIRMKFGLWIP